MEAYQGYFENGRFIPFGEVDIPERKRAIVTILDETIPDADATKRMAVWDEFFSAIESSDELIPERFERVDLTREIEL